MRFLTAGESHGPGLTAIIEGFPAGVAIERHALQALMDQRRLAPGRSSRMGLEGDVLEVTGGLRAGSTTGAPISIFIQNREWERWQEALDPWTGTGRGVTIPRPGHADLAGAAAHGLADLNDVAERASARETAARTAVGGFALQLLGALAVAIESEFEPGEEQLQEALQAGDTLGGRVSLTINGLPGGIGSYVHWERRLDSRLAGALMSLPGVKGVAIGLGFAGTTLPGSCYHDQFHKTPQGFCRLTNNAGGIEGGVSNGEAIEISLAVKPIPTLANPLTSFCLKTGEAALAPVTRHDISAVPALAVIARAVAAWEVAQAITSQFGGANFAALEASYRRQWQYWRELCHYGD